MRKLYILFTFLFITHFVTAQSGPGGVGATDGSSSLKVWLRADQDVFTDAGVTAAIDGQSIQQWNDQSGNNFNATQLTPGEQPSFQDGEVNGLPAVRFDGNNDSFNDDYSGVGGIDARTVFVVYQVSAALQQTSDLGQLWGDYSNGVHVALDARSGNLRGWSFDGNGSIGNQGSYAIGGVDEVGPYTDNNSSQWSYDAFEIAFVEFNAQRNISRQVISDLVSPAGHNLGGDIAEIIVYDDVLSDVQRLRVHNYLSSKYSLSLGSASNSFFTGGDAAFRDQMIVIGRDASGVEYASSIGNSGGLALDEVGGTIDNNDEYIIAGHNGVANEVTNDEVAAVSTGRWKRSWYMERSQGGTIDAGNIDVKISFDLTSAGMGTAGVIGDYKLLYRASLADDFTEVPVSNGAVAGNVVEFELADANFSSGYYTLGTPPVSTLYSYVSGGDWDDAGTWTTDPSGTILTGSVVPGSDNRVVILNGVDVTILANGKEAAGLEVRNGATLDLGTTAGHSFNTIKGQGKISLSSAQFPSGLTTGPNGFGTSSGGIVEFYDGAGSYTMGTDHTFNHMLVNMSGAVLTLLADLTLHGDLTIMDGDLRVGDASSTASRTIAISGDLVVDATGAMSVGTGDAYHQLQLNGDFTNNGSVRFTNQSSPDYINASTTGVVEVTYNNNHADQYTLCSGTTDFYRIIIDKGVDKTYMASFEASDPTHFELYGQNNQPGAADGFSQPQQALALKVGTVRIGPNIYIDELKTGSGNYDLNTNARIWVDNGRLSMSGGTALVVYGTFKVSGPQSLVNITSGSGFILRETGTLKVEEGVVNVSQVRTSVFGAQHVGAYLQSGGTVNVTGSGAASDHYVFSLPYTDNIFQMSGGTLAIERANGTDANSGGVFINSDPTNVSVTGGHVRFEMATGTNFKVTSRAPFFNLYMAKTAGSTSEVYLDGGTVLGQTLPAQPLKVLSQLRIEDAAIFNARDVDVYIGGNLRVLQSGAEYITGSNTTYFDNNRESKIYLRDAAYQQEFYNLVVQKSRDDRFAEISPHGSYTIGATAVIVNNDLSVIAGDFLYNDYMISVLGDIHLTKNITGTAFGQLDLNGAAGDQTITVSSGVTAVIDKLNIDKPTGDARLSGAGLTVNDLVLTSGIFDINEHQLTISNTLFGAPFSATKMIQTAGNASDGGLILPVSGEGTVLFPLGTDANAVVRYTPAELTVPSGGFNDDGFIRVRVVDDELPTLGATGNALSYYWRVSHTDFTTVPLVEYTFGYDDSDDDAGDEANFVPGYVLDEHPFARTSEMAGNINTSTNILTLDSGGGGLSLINASYTAANPTKFSGSPTVYYSRRNDSNGGFTSYDWSDVDAWSTDGALKHGGASVGTYPQAGDVAVIGYGNIGNPGGGASATGLAVTAGNGATHRYEANIDVDVAGIFFESQPGATVGEANLSRLSFPMDRDGALGMVSGGGEIHLRMGASAGEVPDVTGDFGEFNDHQSSSWLYNLTEDGEVVLPGAITDFPTLRIAGDGTASFNRTLVLQTDITARNLLVDQGGTLKIEEDVTVTDTLQLGTDRKGQLLFAGAVSSVTTAYLRLETALFNTSDNANIVTVDNTTPASLEHRLVVNKDIDIVDGDMDFWTDNTGGNNVLLELRGEDMDFTVTSGAVPQLYRLIINTINQSADFVDFNDEVTLNGPTDGAEKALEITSGRLRLLDDNLDFTLSSGGSDFLIPEGSMIVVRQAATIRISGDNTGLRLDGHLRVRDDGRALFNGGVNNYIEYSGSNEAILYIWERGEVIVGSHIRRSLLSDDGSLEFNMGENGSGTPRLLVGQTGGVHSNRGIFEVLNSGSVFELWKGDLIIANGKPSGSVAALYLEPETSYINPAATITIGDVSTQAGQEVTINSAVDMPDFSIDNTSGNTPVAQLVVRPLTVSGDLSISSGTSLEANGLDLTIQGNMNNEGTYSPDGNTTYFTGTAQTITGNTDFYDLVINPGTSVTLAATTDILVENNLQVLSGQLADGGNTIEVKKDITMNGAHVSASPAAGGILMSGVIPQSISGNGGELGRLEIDNNEGVTTFLNTTFSGDLELTNGVLDIRSQKLLLLSGSSIEGAPFSVNKMIATTGVSSDEGVVQQVTNTGSTNLLVPLGINGATPKYTPVTFNISSKGAGTSEFFFKPIDASHPTVVEDTESGGAPAQVDDLNNVLQYYWEVSGTNISALNATMSLTFDPVDVATADGNTINDYVGARLDGLSNWTFPGILDIPNNEIEFSFAGSSDIDEAYTAGVPEAFPAEIPVIRAVNAMGNWNNPNNWRNITAGTPPGVNIPAGGPNGVIVEIPAGLTVAANGNNRAAYKTLIDGRLEVGGTDGHIMGQVSGTGVLATDNIGYLPAGNYDEFSDCTSGGTFEFGGSSDYQLTAISIPDQVYNLSLTGSGRRQLRENMTVCNDLFIEGTADFGNFGGFHNQLEVKGNIILVSGASFNSGTGADATVVFSGSSFQQIAGDFTGSNAFNNLEVNNSAGVVLNSAVEVERELLLTAGNINTTVTNLLTLTNIGTFVTPANGSSASFIDGPMAKQINNGGNFTFPVGKSDRLRNIGIRNTNTTTTMMWVAEYFEQDPQQAPYGPAISSVNGMGGADAGISNAELWTLEAVEHGNGEVILHWDNQSGIHSHLGELRVMRWDADLSEWASEGNAAYSGTAASGYLRSNMVGFSEQAFTLGATDLNNNPLPVTLTAFIGRTVDHTSVLEWETSSELNNDYFELQRSYDGENFEVIAQVQGNGSSEITQSYQYIDKAPVNGRNYYRLKQVDFDGTDTIFDDLVVLDHTLEVNEVTLVAYPNPTDQNNIYIRVSADPSAPVYVRMVDLYGRVYFAQQFEPYELMKDVKIEATKTLKQGVLILTIEQGHLKAHRRIIINR